MSTSRKTLTRTWRLTALALCALLIAAAFTSPAWAFDAPIHNPQSKIQNQQAGIALTARGGFDSYYRDGQWTPVRVTVANDGPDLTGSLRIDVPRSGGGETRYTRPVDLPTQSRREICFYVSAESYFSSLKVELVAGSKIIASAPVRLSQVSATDFLYGVLAASPSAFNDLTNVTPLSGVARVAQLELADLPPLAAGWKGLDGLVISDVDTGALSPEQRQALADWVQHGGRLIVAGGPGWQKAVAGLGALLPLVPAATRQVTDLSPLVRFAAATSLEGAAVAAQGQLTADAVPLVESEGLPLVAYRRSGYGLVAFVAVDPALAPLRGWDGMAGLFRGILSVTIDRPNWANGFYNWSAANDGAKAVPGLDVPSPWQICGFLSIYVIIVGPLNFLILRRLKRSGLAWFTIPVIVLLFSVATYFVGYEVRGTQAVLHRLAVVQVWPGAERAKVEQVVGLFSPRRTAYEVTFEPGALARPLPNASFASGAGQAVVEQSDRTRLPQVRTEIGAVEAFVAEGQVTAPRFDANITLKLTGNKGYGSAQLDGTVTNQSDLTLEDAVLLAPGGALPLGDLKPGQTAAPNSLYLTFQRATAAKPNTILSINPPVGVTIYPAGTYGGYGPDSTFNDILTVNYPMNQETYRRNMLLSAVLDQYSGIGRGNGVYLVGWVSASPLGAKVSVPFKTLDLSLYFIALPYSITFGQGTVSVPAGLMTWTVLQSNPGTYAPYDSRMDAGGEVVIRFTPSLPVTFKSVQALTLHFNNFMGYAPGSVAGGMKVSLYNFIADTWVEQAGVIWGDTSILAPAQYVGEGGEILVRVQNLSGTEQGIQQLDFTLDVER